MKFGIEGYFNLIVRDANTLEAKQETGFFKNLITNIGLDAIAGDGVLWGVAVGTGTAAPTPTDTNLQAQTAYSFNNIIDSIRVKSAGAPYWSGARRTFRLNQGQATGNLTEVGICLYNTNRLWSRALILDATGNPTTLTVLPNEVLDVTYECRIYTQQGDVTGGPISLLGVDYNWTVRACNASEDLAYDSLLSNGVAKFLQFLGTSDQPAGLDVVGLANNNAGNGSSAIQAYVQGSFKRQSVLTWSISQGNGATGIRSFAFVCGPQGLGTPRFKAEFDKVFPKDNTITLTLTFEWSWGRHTI